jgi:hypothetical protein
MDMEDQNTNPPQLNPDLAGYPTVDALVQGYRSSGEEAKRLREKSDKLEGLLTQMLEQQAANQRVVPDRRGGRPEDRLVEFGIPVDALDEFVAGRVAKAFEPVTRGIQARQTIVGSHPDYLQFEQDVAQFIGSDQELSSRYGKMFETDPAGAMEYAFLKFADSRRRSVSGGAAPAGGSVDAAIPMSRNGEGRRAPDSDQHIRDAFDRWQKSGSTADAQNYAKARLRGVVTDEFLNG